jgi:Protein of unknown function (DUF3089)
MTLLALLLAAASAGNDYSAAANWLCLPGHEDACAADEDATIVQADGTLTVEKFKPVKDAPVDCFYVYPTVSLQQTGNADMRADPEETRVVAQQFARFGAVCQTYAPLYRQTTIKAMFARLGGQPTDADPELATKDIIDAWHYYLAHYNRGRGVVLVGHSQGSNVLIELVKREIDGKPPQKQLLSVILAGSVLQVPAGKDAGGDFQKVPLCHSSSDLGCAIAYASFRATAPPPPRSFFGRSFGPGTVAACVNPAALAGGSGPAKAYFGARSLDSWAEGKTVQTPFVEVPGLLTAECAHTESANYLAITVHGDLSARTSEIPGGATAAWGLHRIDMNLFMGNFLELVRSETKAFLHK